MLDTSTCVQVMEVSAEELLGNNSDTMEMSVDDECEASYLKDVEDLNQSNESIKESYRVPLFNLNQSNGLQSSQGFCFGDVPTQNVATSQVSVFQGISTGSVSEDTKPVFISSEFDLASLSQTVGKTEPTVQNMFMNNSNQTVFSTGALMMAVQNNPGFITFGQTSNTTNVFNTDNVFTFGGGQDSSQSNATNTNSQLESSAKNSEGDSKGSRLKHPVKHRQRKNRSQSTASDNVSALMASFSFTMYPTILCFNCRKL